MRLDYPKLLVFLQFSSIFALVILSFKELTLLRVAIFIIGAVIGVIAINTHTRGNFTIRPILKENAKLITTGIYRYIRHPMYFSVIVMMSSFITDLITLSIFLFLIFILYLKAKKEESLWLEHNFLYKEYMIKSRFIIPFIL